MNERIKQLRKALGLTQQEFAAQVGMKQNTIATYEMGRGHPSTRAIRYICREYHVNEHWLCTGEGEMFHPTSQGEEISDFAARAINDPELAFPRHVLLMLARMTPTEWEQMEQLGRKFFSNEA